MEVDELFNITTKEDFERDYSQRHWSWYQDLLSECVRNGVPGKWLDLGAGLGLFVECAQRFGINCIGLEGSDYAIETALKRFPGITMKKNLLSQPLPFADNSIATIMCYQVLEHLLPEVMDFTLRESYRILQPGGRIFIYSPSKFNKRERQDPTHINLFSLSELRRSLNKVGFKIVEEDNTPIFFSAKKFLKRLSIEVFRLFPFSFLSATANCVAEK